jgi:Protein of unknown function (DUF3572)
MSLRLKTSTGMADTSAIPLQFMAYLASDEERLQSFCGTTGFGQNDLVANLPDPAFQGFLLDFALADESLLLAFCADKALSPETVMKVRRALPGFSE